MLTKKQASPSENPVINQGFDEAKEACSE